eukprot:scaffold4405_cov31-Tisochrysis_lutea.AAC.1
MQVLAHSCHVGEQGSAARAPMQHKLHLHALVDSDTRARAECGNSLFKSVLCRRSEQYADWALENGLAGGDMTCGKDSESTLVPSLAQLHGVQAARCLQLAEQLLAV